MQEVKDPELRKKILEEFVNDPTSRPFFVDKEKLKRDLSKYGI